MAVTETEHFLGTALAIQEINRAAACSVARSRSSPTIRPPIPPPTALADRLLTEDGISVIFGCSTSAERKAILSAIERRNGLLWYPSLYEGFEYSPNVIYTGASPNQNSFPLAEYLVRNYGRRMFLVGSDYVYPRESNRIMRDLVESYGGEIVGEFYVPLESRCRSAGRSRAVKQQEPDVLFSTVVGRTAQTSTGSIAKPASSRRMPIASLTMAEGEIPRSAPSCARATSRRRPISARSTATANRRFVADFHRAFGADKPVSMWSAGAYAQVHLFAMALERAGTLDTQRLVDAALGLSFEAPEGSIQIDPENNHTWLTPRIGRPRDGSFEIVWEAKAAGQAGPLSGRVAAGRALDQRRAAGR